MATIQHRCLILVNTDSQRRCYDGHHYSSEWQWTAWSDLESGLKPDRVQARMEWWKELNDYAVSQRGKSATKEFRIIPEEA